jgi:hypothetical protein
MFKADSNRMDRIDRIKARQKAARMNDEGRRMNDE